MTQTCSGVGISFWQTPWKSLQQVSICHVQRSLRLDTALRSQTAEQDFTPDLLAGNFIVQPVMCLWLHCCLGVLIPEGHPAIPGVFSDAPKQLCQTFLLLCFIHCRG